ncbi:MAG TPA: thioredoxin family protein [Acidimicrobiia bacterium]|nr:thioredoxin family protein [Acidimicrobiia bacterium]
MGKISRVVVMLSVLAVACGGGTEGVAVVANTQQTLGPGPNRLLMAIASPDDGTFLSSPDVATVARFFRDGEEVAAVNTDWVWAIPGVRGFLVANVVLPEAGRWEVVLEPEGSPPTPPTPFGVQESSPVPDIGDMAIPAETRTHPEYDLDVISSDADPDPRLYEMSLDEALANGQPTVVAFATPAFCRTASCGPTLDVVRSVMGDHPGVNFVHVEIYADLDEAAAGRLEPVEAVLAWGLPSEPWVFVMDDGGVVTARFEGATGADELIAALENLP